jgi:hypothetical protein
MEGMQAQNMAVVVSKVDQNVVGILSHVGSAVKPNVRRLSRRTIEVMQTLRSSAKEKNKVCMEDKISRENGTDKPPTPNIAYIPTFFFLVSCRCRSSFIGRSMIMMS